MEILDNGSKIKIAMPVNMHAHFRQDKFLRFLVGIYLKYGWRGIVEVMPNCEPPILTGSAAHNMQQEILQATRLYPNSEDFNPLVSMQITPQTTIEMLEQALEYSVWLFKIYPFEVTTNSQYGVQDYRQILPLLRFLEKRMVTCYDGVIRRAVVLLHPESPNPAIEGIYKEEHFINHELQIILDECPTLAISLEHISTVASIHFLEKYGWGSSTNNLIVATVPIQYMMSTLDDVIGYSKRSGLKVCPHNACKPTPKFRRDTEALTYAVTNGSMKCLLAGNDDAAHPRSQKENGHANCGTANTWASLAMIIDVFEKAGTLEKNIDKFLSGNACEFHVLTNTDTKLTLIRKDWMVPNMVIIPEMNDSVVPWMAGQTMHWQVA